MSTMSAPGITAQQLSAPTPVGNPGANPPANQPGTPPANPPANQPGNLPANPPAQKPEWAKDIPDKFVRGTPEESLREMAKAHGELERTLGQRPGTQPANPQTASDLTIEPPKEDTSIIGGIDAVLKTAGLKAEDVASQWKQHGQLTPEQYQAFGRAKFSKEMINDYLSGQAARAEVESMKVQRAVAEATKVAGGEQQLQTLRQWAANPQAFPPDRLARLNAQLKADPSFYPDFVEILAAAHSRANGSNNSQPLINGQGGAAGDGIPTTLEEFGKLMYRVNNGDADAVAILNKMPMETIQKFGS